MYDDAHGPRSRAVNHHMMLPHEIVGFLHASGNSHQLYESLEQAAWLWHAHTRVAFINGNTDVFASVGNPRFENTGQSSRTKSGSKKTLHSCIMSMYTSNKCRIHDDVVTRSGLGSGAMCSAANLRRWCRVHE